MGYRYKKEVPKVPEEPRSSSLFIRINGLAGLLGFAVADSSLSGGRMRKDTYGVLRGCMCLLYPSRGGHLGAYSHVCGHCIRR